MLGIDIGGTRTKWVRWSPQYGVLDQGEQATPRSGALDVLSAVAGLIDEGKVENAGVAVPGRLSDDLVLGNVVVYSGATTVVIGGGVAPAFTFMRRAVEAELAARRRLVGPVDLRLAQLGSGAGALGAALTVAHNRDGDS